MLSPSTGTYSSCDGNLFHQDRISMTFLENKINRDKGKLICQILVSDFKLAIT